MFDREQMVFIVEQAMNAGLDRIESCIPDAVPLAIADRPGTRDFIGGCIETVGMNLACLWAQTIGETINDGMAIGDALIASGFEKLAKDFVAERMDPDWPGPTPGYTVHPVTKPYAEKFVDEQWGDYFSPYSDLGYELSDGSVIEFPESDSGDIRYVDQYGNHEETRQYSDGEHWQEWYKVFDDAKPENRFFCGQNVRAKDQVGHISEIDEDEVHVIVDEDEAGGEIYKFADLTPFPYS